jgi:fucose permease
MSNSFLSKYLDLGHMLVIGASFQILGQALRAWFPPFGLYAFTFCLASLGQAYQDTYANTFVSSVKAAHRWLGFIHAMYMAGCLVGPFVSTSMATRSPTQWNLFYLVPLGLGIFNVALVGIAFHDRMAWKKQSREALPDESTAIYLQENEHQQRKGALKEMKRTLSKRGVWLISLFFFFYLGSVITAGGIV